MTSNRVPPEADTPGADALAPRFPVLDALRAVGALAVLTTHVAFQAGDYGRHGVVGTLLARLDIGVALFFVLSGFLLARPYLARAALGRPRPASSTYYVKRFWRIYPVYVVAVVLAFVVVPENADLGVRDLVVTLTLTNTFVDPTLPHGITQMWSLAVEVCFYLVLPWLMLAATGRRRLNPARVVAVLLAASAASVWWYLRGSGVADDLGPGSPVQWLPAYLTWFAVGIGLALAHVLHVSGSRSRAVRVLLRTGRQPGVCWVLAGALLLAAATPLAGPTGIVAPGPGEALTKNLLYALIAGLVVLTGIVADPAGRFGTSLGHALPRHLGLISYSLFCLHQMLVGLLARAMGYPLFGGHGIELWFLTVLTSLAAAEGVYRFVELPGMRVRTLLTRGRASAASTPTIGTTSR